MMELEETETIYKQEQERAEKEFLDGIKNKRNIEELEKIYQRKLKLSREKYYKSVLENLKKKKNTENRKITSEKEKSEVFKVQPGNFDLSFFQKLKFKLGLLFFKLKFGLHNRIRRETPKAVFYTYTKSKIKTKKTILKIENSTIKFSDSVKTSSEKTWNALKEFIKSVYIKTMEFPGKIIERLKRKKPAEKTRENRAEGEKSENEKE